jgi:hypothetical protein
MVWRKKEKKLACTLDGMALSDEIMYPTKYAAKKTEEQRYAHDKILSMIGPLRKGSSQEEIEKRAMDIIRNKNSKKKLRELMGVKEYSPSSPAEEQRKLKEKVNRLNKAYNKK